MSIDLTKANSRVQAEIRGLPTYFTGKPCKHGHIAERRTSDGHCFDCIVRQKALRRIRYPNWWVEYSRSEHGKEVRRLNHMLRVHGLTKEDFNAMMFAQGEKCACCRKKFGNRRDNRPEIDHKHKPEHKRKEHQDKKAVRGLLCRGCNSFVAAFDHPLRKTFAAYVDQNGFL